MKHKWLNRNTFHHSEFSDLDHLVEAKLRKKLQISLCLPTLNEQETIGKEIVMFKSELMDRYPLLAEIADYPELYEAIVADRNRNWVNTIDKLLRDEEDYLVIVGALHLIGEDGMPQLLEARGYKVSQMHEQ